MSQSSAIEWTDTTWNPVTGCDRVSPGCAHCYALTLAKRLKGMGQPGYQRDGDPKTSGPGFGVTVHPHKLEEPLRWRKPRMVFVNSMSDLFHDEVPDQFIWEVFANMAQARQHTFQVLTKRPERARALLADRFGNRASIVSTQWPFPNVWLGVSIENARYTWRADVLREIPAAVRFISAEPLLGSLFAGSHEGTNRRPAAPEGDVSAAPGVPNDGANGHDSVGRCSSEASSADAQDERPTRGKRPLDLTAIDWVIVGGESGPKARPMDPAWAREIRDACLSHCRDCASPAVTHLVADCDRGIRPAFFFKQWGGPTPKSNGRLLDGREWNEMPAART